MPSNMITDTGRPPWRELPPALIPLRDLALDLRWTWSHEADALWARIDNDLWQRTRNPWTILEDRLGRQRLDELAADVGFVAHLYTLVAARRAYLADRGWFAAARGGAAAGRRRLFQHGVRSRRGAAAVCRRAWRAGGRFPEGGERPGPAGHRDRPVVPGGLFPPDRSTPRAGSSRRYPYNDPSSMPIEPVRAAGGGRLHIPVELPGRTLQLRVWRVIVGRTLLYLLDSNDPVNGPVDRGITGKLYGGGSEMRLMQEIVLGVGGWRLVEALHPEIEVCHLNEGHAAFAVLERARAVRAGAMGWVSTRPCGRPAPATSSPPIRRWTPGFDRFPLDLLAAIWPGLGGGRGCTGRVSSSWASTTGRPSGGLFNMANLATRGALLNFGVSRLHGAVSRRIFQPLYPRWPEHEVPFDHVTNGVHVPTWDSAAADAIWTEACGKDRWRHEPEDMGERIASGRATRRYGRCAARPAQALVRKVRARLGVQLSGRGHPPEVVAVGETVLDPNVLTLGFARRFTAYKRPDLLLSDRPAWQRLLCDEARPVATRARGQGASGRRGRQADDPGMDRVRAGPSGIAAGWCSWRITTFRWRRSWCRAWMSGSTRRAVPGRPAAPAA